MISGFLISKVRLSIKIGHEKNHFGTERYSRRPLAMTPGSVSLLLSKYQSGFRPLHSTSTALIDIADNWYLNIDDGLTNTILFTDLKKAFDSTEREILLSKLELYGFKGASLNLFRDYLSDRTQVTVIAAERASSNIIRI